MKVGKKYEKRKSHPTVQEMTFSYSWSKVKQLDFMHACNLQYKIFAAADIGDVIGAQRRRREWPAHMLCMPVRDGCLSPAVCALSASHSRHVADAILFLPTPLLRSFVSLTSLSELQVFVLSLPPRTPLFSLSPLLFPPCMSASTPAA